MTGQLKVTILGCGSSGGVPRLGGAGGAGEWGACDPANPKNRRRRCSILVERGATKVLVDTSPDMREQLLDARVGRLDGVLITHDHADQVHGLDDLRMLAQVMMRRIDLYAADEALRALKARFGYCFKGSEVGGYPAILEDHVIARPFRDFAIEGEGGAIPVRTFDQDHGTMVSQGFRFGPIAYSSDVVDLDDAAFETLRGVECWIVDALRYRPHPTHAHVEKTLGWIERVKPRRAILTNLHTDLDFEILRQALPAGVEPAFDGLVIEL
jgi:phosphoribosyl 1,2-cyclic phosphate phosphodiesterase